jgi:serine/threonine-protein kinase HipA
MNSRRCLYCYKKLSEEESDFHPQCSKKMFGATVPPVLDYSNDQMLNLAEIVIKSRISVTGVQPKLSLGIQKLSKKSVPQKFTIVGVWDEYILKPPTQLYPHLPELEDLTMHLASIAGIKTVSHSLIRLKSGEPAYITRRIDRQKGKKLHLEDMCQLTERLTEHKYRGSYEQVGKAIVKYSQNPGLDIINFFEQVVFSFLTGNNDMHLKNFSLFKYPKLGYGLCPAYDMVASELVVQGDDEELALTLNGKKKKLKRKDFEEAMSRFGLDERVFANIFARFQKVIPQWHDFIEISFLPPQLKEAYRQMIDRKSKQIEL